MARNEDFPSVRARKTQRDRIRRQSVNKRLWRSVKYEEVYLRAYEGVSDARASIGRYLDFYNSRRPYSGLDGITPDHAYFTPLPLRLAA
jgi:putative transposase